MAKLKIASGLNGFNLLERITAVRPDQLAAERAFCATPAWQALEALAQAGGLHARWLHGFACECHVMKIANFDSAAELSGGYLITASLNHRSRDALAYAVSGRPVAHGPALRASLIYAVRPTETIDQFQAARFACLRRV